MDNQFFNYHKYTEKRFQFKRSVVREIDTEKYYFIPIRYHNKEIYIKTPKIVVPFELNIYNTDNNEKCYYYVLSFTDNDIDENINKFYQFLLKTETYIQEIVKENLINWNCDYEFETLTFKSCFKESSGTPLFRLKISNTGKQVTEIYNEIGKLQNIEEVELYVTSQCHIMSLLELQNIWINSTEYGITWRVRQMKVYPSTRPIGGISLLDENISIHTVKIIEKEEYVTHKCQSHSPPKIQTMPKISAPPPPPPPPLKNNLLRKKPVGGVAILPFLDSIKTGNFGLKKTSQNNKLIIQQKGNFPEISLAEILKIRQSLKKRSEKGNDTESEETKEIEEINSGNNEKNKGVNHQNDPMTVNINIEQNKKNNEINSEENERNNKINSEENKRNNEIKSEENEQS